MKKRVVIVVLLSVVGFFTALYASHSNVVEHEHITNISEVQWVNERSAKLWVQPDRHKSAQLVRFESIDRIEIVDDPKLDFAEIRYSKVRNFFGAEWKSTATLYRHPRFRIQPAERVASR